MVLLLIVGQRGRLGGSGEGCPRGITVGGLGGSGCAAGSVPGMMYPYPQPAAAPYAPGYRYPYRVK